MTPASESFEALTRIINRIDSLPFRRRMGVAASPPVPPRRPAGGGIDAPHGFFTPGGSPESGKPEFRKGRHVMLRRIAGEAAEHGALQAAGCGGNLRRHGADRDARRQIG